MASLALLLFLATGPIAPHALWGLALLLALLNLGLRCEQREARRSPALIGGMALSWIVIASWWAHGFVAALLLPALVILGAFALLIVGGELWSTRQGPAPTSPLREGALLGLVGHLFVGYVASQPTLALPPWPILGVLGVLDLAILAAALWARRGALHAGALAASQLILAVLAGTVAAAHTAEGSNALFAALLAALALAALGLVGLPLARRRGSADPWFQNGAVAGLYGAQLVLAVAGGTPAAPAWPWLAAFGALPLVGLIGLSRRDGRHARVFGALGAAALCTWTWSTKVAPYDPEQWRGALVLAAVPYLLLTAYPLLFRPQAAPYWVAVLASLPFFMFAREAIVAGGHAAVIGALPLAEALLLAGLLLRLLRHKAATGQADRALLALTAGAALAFVTVAIPLQLEKQWITLGWALEAAALAWLHTRLRHRGLLLGSFGLAAAVVVRLALNQAVLGYHARSATPLLNWYLYTYLIGAAALMLASVWLRRTDDRVFPHWPRSSDLQAAGATLLLFLLVNIEIADFYSTGTQLTFNFSSTLAQDLTYTLAWALFAIGLLAAGIVYRRRVPRIAALLLLVITVAKCFLHDLWRLGGLYRVGSFVGLALCLALVAIALQKFVLARPQEKP
ncbi:MAG: DUF2339 domain-containing protein [Proteobacteria bacterium]|nr:DUF2339 domain-containing protein [Pseudomonadota bacterium]